MVFLGPWFTVRDVVVEGSRFTEEGVIRAAVPAGTSIWLLSKDEITSRLLQDTRIESVAILRGLPDTIKVVVHERTPSLIWLSGELQTVLDQSGVAFAQYASAAFPAPGTRLGDGLANVPRVTDTKGLPVTVDQQVVGPTFISFADEVRTLIAAALPDLEIDHIEIADTTYDITVVAKQGMRVQFNTLADPGIQVRNLTRLVHQQKAGYSSQVDLRIDRWAYVQ
jgi:hypothetical protein